LAYVFYDVETTGLSTDFDQITQFAAIKADHNFNVLETFEVHARISPFLVPSPEAMCINGTTIEEMLNPSLPSFYEATLKIYKKLVSWGPSVFVGYNSINFDEEILRKSFYRALLPEFLTNTPNNSRADAWLMMVSVANHHPGLLNIGTKMDGSPSFRLVDIARANGISLQRAHNAMSDVKATYELCKLIEEKAPERWSDFMQLSRKPAAQSFLESEEMFCLLSPYKNPAVCIAHLLGQSRTKPWVSYSVNLEANHADLANLSAESLAVYLSTNPYVVREIKANAFPLISDVDNAQDYLGYSCEQIETFEHSLGIIQVTLGYRDRLITSADLCLPEYPNSSFPEKNLYGHGFVTDSERNKLWSFHDLPWINRIDVLKTIADPRYKRLGAQLIYAESPTSLSDEIRENVENFMAQACLHGDGTVKKPPLNSLREACQTLSNHSFENKTTLTGYLDYLQRVESYALASLRKSAT